VFRQSYYLGLFAFCVLFFPILCNAILLNAMHIGDCYRDFPLRPACCRNPLASRSRQSGHKILEIFDCDLTERNEHFVVEIPNYHDDDNLLCIHVRALCKDQTRNNQNAELWNTLSSLWFNLSPKLSRALTHSLFLSQEEKSDYNLLRC
jgi:hypothetical protein